jgi:group I intron endonuclease
MVIYKTTNLINGMLYIGKKSQDCNTYLGSGFLLKRAIAKYGRENFKKEIIDTANTLDELNEKEKYWISFYNTIDKSIGYNLTIGGEGGDTISMHPDKERIIEQMRLHMLGKNTGPRPKYVCDAISASRLGRTWEDLMGEEKAKELREKSSKNWKENNPMLYIDFSGENNPMYGKHHTTESIDKIRNKAKGRPSPATGKFKKYEFYKNDILIYVANGQSNAIKYCKENKLSYSALVKKLMRWNEYNCKSI